MLLSGTLAGRPPGRDRGAARPPVVRGQPVPPGVQVPPGAPAPAVPRVRGHGARAAQRRGAAADGRGPAGPGRRGPRRPDRGGRARRDPGARRAGGLAASSSAAGCLSARPSPRSSPMITAADHGTAAPGAPGRTPTHEQQLAASAAVRAGPTGDGSARADDSDPSGPCVVRYRSDRIPTGRARRHPRIPPRTRPVARLIAFPAGSPARDSTPRGVPTPCRTAPTSAPAATAGRAVAPRPPTACPSPSRTR